MKRILTFHDSEAQGDGRIGPAYYMETDYEPVAVRIHAEQEPHLDDATFDIFDDGVSIFEDRGGITRNSSGVITSNTSYTYVFLGKDQSSEENAENFKDNKIIEEGSWLTCEIVGNGGGKTFTIQLELESSDEEDE